MDKPLVQICQNLATNVQGLLTDGEMIRSNLETHLQAVIVGTPPTCCSRLGRRTTLPILATPADQVKTQLLYQNVELIFTNGLLLAGANAGSAVRTIHPLSTQQHSDDPAD